MDAKDALPPEPYHGKRKTGKIQGFYLAITCRTRREGRMKKGSANRALGNVLRESFRPSRGKRNKDDCHFVVVKELNRGAGTSPRDKQVLPKGKRAAANHPDAAGRGKSCHVIHCIIKGPPKKNAHPKKALRAERIEGRCVHLLLPRGAHFPFGGRGEGSTCAEKKGRA